jgi:nucleotide-binding universal stress UspA family protein
MVKPVVVGVDGSQESLRAVRFAAAEAASRGARLRVIHARLWPLYPVPLGAPPDTPPGASLQAQADRLLAEATEAATLAGPDLRVDTSLLTGEAGRLLVRASSDAQLLVVGNRGLGVFTELLLGVRWCCGVCACGLPRSGRSRCRPSEWTCCRWRGHPRDVRPCRPGSLRLGSSPDVIAVHAYAVPASHEMPM